MDFLVTYDTCSVGKAQTQRGRDSLEFRYLQFLGRSHSECTLAEEDVIVRIIGIRTRSLHGRELECSGLSGPLKSCRSDIRHNHGIIVSTDSQILMLERIFSTAESGHVGSFLHVLVFRRSRSSLVRISVVNGESLVSCPVYAHSRFIGRPGIRFRNPFVAFYIHGLRDLSHGIFHLSFSQFFLT